MGFVVAILVAALVLFVINPMVALLAALPFLAPFWLTRDLASFLYLPFFVALAVTLITTWLSKRRAALDWHWPVPAILIFITTFFAGAEFYSSYLINAAAIDAKSNCNYTHSFLHSVRKYGTGNSEHALYTKDGTLYLWSYREMNFQPARYATSHCTRAPDGKFYAE